MLLSVVFSLERLSAQRPQTITGEKIHGWLLDLVGSRDPSYWEELHSDLRHKPFTIGIGSSSGEFGAGVAKLSPEEPSLAIRITSLSNRFTILLGNIIEDLREFRLDGSTFCLRYVSSDEREHVLAGRSSFERLWESGLRSSLAQRNVILRFLTPTAFSFDYGCRPLNDPAGKISDQGRAGRQHDRRNTLFPIARLVFTSLAEKWGKWAPENLRINPETQEIFSNLVREEEHAIRTVRPLEYSKFKVKGFVGNCEYSIGHKAPAEVHRVLHALAAFAFYGGVGLKTTWGMGLTVCEEDCR